MHKMKPNLYMFWYPLMKFVRIGLHNLCQICSFLCIISELTYAESCSWATEPEVKTSRRSELLQGSQPDTTMSCCDGDRMWAVPEFIAVGTTEWASGWGSCKSDVRQPQIIAYAYFLNKKQKYAVGYSNSSENLQQRVKKHIISKNKLCMLLINKKCFSCPA